MFGLWWTKRHWGRFFPSTSVSSADHSTNFSIIIITRCWHNRYIVGSSAQWTQLDSTPHYTNLILIWGTHNGGYEELYLVEYEVNRCFGRKYHLRLSLPLNLTLDFSMAYSSILKMEATCSTKRLFTLSGLHPTTSNYCRGQENVDLYIHSPIRLHGVVLN
jgi:hypothetical protein